MPTPIMYAEPVSEAAVERNDALSEAGTEGESASATQGVLMQAQQAQREAMLVGQHSLNDSHKRLLEVREAMQHDGDEDEQDELQGEDNNQCVPLCSQFCFGTL